MKRTVFVRSCVLAALLACASASVSAQQPEPRTRRGGLDNLSLPSGSRGGMSVASASGWQVFAPAGENFSVAMPGTPRDKAAGRSQEKGHSYRVQADGIEYEVTRTDAVPKAFFGMQGFEDDFLDSLSGSLVGSAQREWPQMKLQLVSASQSPLGGCNGRDFELASDQYRSHVRAYLVKQSLVIVAMTGLKSAFTDEKLEKFFGSLSLSAR
jgi:hypothetical protein